MFIKPGYSLKVIKENVDTLQEIVHVSTAMSVAISHARAHFKREKPDSTAFPEHLMPGKTKAALEAYNGEE